MTTYIAFLRGINVSGQKKIKMADLRESLEQHGFKNTKTYIQSGNIIVDWKPNKSKVLKTTIESILTADFGFEVPVLTRTPQEIHNILQGNPFKDQIAIKGLYFTLLEKKPSTDRILAFKELKFEHEDFCYTDECVYLNCKQGAGKAKLNNNLIENKLGVKATTRNLNTMLKMLELSGIN